VRHGLAEIGADRGIRGYDDFSLLTDSGSGDKHYFVPGDRVQVLEIPPSFFLSGWHLVLEPREIATWLMIRDLTELQGSFVSDEHGVSAVDADRWGLYGISPDVYEAHRELDEFGVITRHDSLPNRNRGRVKQIEGPQYLEPYGYD